MKKKGKYVLVIGAVVVVLLMVSSACAVSVVQESKAKNATENDSNEIYIDPNIYLTRKHLPLLKRSIRELDDDLISKELLQHIIDVIEIKGEINSNEIRDIIQYSDVELAGVHGPGFIFGHGPGTAWGFPFTILRIAFRILTAPIPSLIMGWEADNSQGGHVPPNSRDINVKLRSKVYDGNHRGFAIGYIGLAYIHLEIVGVDWYEFDLAGIGLLFFVI